MKERCAAQERKKKEQVPEAEFHKEEIVLTKYEYFYEPCGNNSYAGNEPSDPDPDNENIIELFIFASPFVDEFPELIFLENHALVADTQ